MDKTLAQQQQTEKMAQVGLFLCVCSGVLFGRSRLRTGFSVRIDYGRLGVRLFLSGRHHLRCQKYIFRCVRIRFKKLNNCKKKEGNKVQRLE